jgi:predicted transcriptional regulator
MTQRSLEVRAALLRHHRAERDALEVVVIQQNAEIEQLARRFDALEERKKQLQAAFEELARQQRPVLDEIGRGMHEVESINQRTLAAVRRRTAALANIARLDAQSQSL